MSLKIQNGQVIPSQIPNKSSGTVNSDFEKAFIESLNRKKDSVSLSAHAINRMDERQIKLDVQDMEKINKAVDALEKKGARESLLIYNDKAFIASIRNRTIITAMKSGELDIVTNIDSAISIK